MLELADPLGPSGARGMAEMGMIPYAPAVVAGLHDATGSSSTPSRSLPTGSWPDCAMRGSRPAPRGPQAQGSEALDAGVVWPEVFGDRRGDRLGVQGVGGCHLLEVGPVLGSVEEPSDF